jgi:hypothetical protein
MLQPAARAPRTSSPNPRVKRSSVNTSRVKALPRVTTFPLGPRTRSRLLPIAQAAVVINNRARKTQLKVAWNQTLASKRENIA